MDATILAAASSPEAEAATKVLWVIVVCVVAFCFWAALNSDNGD